MRLRPGARIAVVAPAGIFDPKRVQRGQEIVAEWGFTLVPAPNLHKQHGYTAGTLEERQADLNWALTDPEIDAVWFARGGFGTAHLLPHLPWNQLDGRPVIGFSDATALLSGLRMHDLPAIHGPVLQTLTDDAFGAQNPVIVDDLSRRTLHHLLTEGTPPVFPGELLCGAGVAVRGPVVGGNLAVLASLAGTPWALRAQGAILLLEDVGEVPYRLDRMLTQLKQSGALDGVVGVGLGTFLETRADPELLLDMLRDWLIPLGVPVLAGLPFGHGPRNLPWPVGALGEMTPQGLHFLHPHL